MGTLEECLFDLGFMNFTLQNLIKKAYLNLIYFLFKE